MTITLRQPRGRDWLLIAGITAGAVILVPLICVIAGSALSGHSFLLYVPYFYLMMAYSEPILYVAINLGVILLVLATLIWAKPNWIAVAWMLASIVVVVAYPLGGYQPALSARSGLRMVNATQPAFFIDSIVKRAEVSIEKRVCLYHLDGWAQDGVFYFQSMCRDGSSMWSINPESDARPVEVTSLHENLDRPAVAREEALAFLRMPGIDPPEAEPYTRPLLLADGEALKSPDGRWLAVVSQHIYGPQDVLLIQINE